MKAHTAEKLEKEIILSIGMIVKNEEKVLERCLKSLQPLMKAIPSELIIADTGSTDSTVEIAKKYTDNVFHFEWINDFAAARNSTLEKAKGKWYFFLDADEYLDDDIHEIVGFFKIPDLYNHYRCAQIDLRSYSNMQLSTYSSIMIPRFFRVLTNEKKRISFIGAIHETILMSAPLGYFQTILHHTGYIFNSTAQLKNKQDRNLELMREEYENTLPENRLRILSLLIDSATYYPEELEKYVKEALELIRHNKYNLYSRALYAKVIRYYRNVNLIHAINICDEYFSSYPEAFKYVATIDILIKKAEILGAIGEYEKSYETYLLYFDLYQNYLKEKIDISDLTALNVYGTKKNEYIKCIGAAINCVLKLFKYDEAYKLFDTIDLNEVKDNDYAFVFSLLKTICIKSKEFKRLSLCYEETEKNSNDDLKLLTLNMLESTFYSYSNSKERICFAEQLAECGANGKYIELMNLYLEQNNTNFTDRLNNFLSSVTNWKEGYSEAIFLAVKNKLDTSIIADKMDSSLFGAKLSLIANTHDDFAEYVLDYGVPEQFTSSIKRFKWITTMYECAVYRCFELNDDKKYKLYLMFANLLGEYVSNIYNSELLQDEEDITVLPPLHKFGYYMLQANNALMNGDNIGYIKEMKKALLNCETMKEIVEFMLDQFKKKMNLS